MCKLLLIEPPRPEEIAPVQTALQITRDEHHALMRDVPAFKARADVLATEIAAETGCAEAAARLAADMFLAFPLDERWHGMGDAPRGKDAEYGAALMALRSFKAVANAPALQVAAWTRAAPAIFDAHLVAAEQALVSAAALLTRARAVCTASGFDDPAGLAELTRAAEKLIWDAQQDAWEAGNVAQQVRCDREDARYAAFVARAA